MNRLLWENPIWLWLLIFAIPAVWYSYRKHVRTRWFMLAITSLLIIAAARPHWNGTTDKKRYILLIDNNLSSDKIPVEYQNYEKKIFTGSPAKALRETASTLPVGGATLALYGTFNETESAFRAVTEELALRKFPLKAVPVASSTHSQFVSVQELQFPLEAGVGSTAAITATVESPTRQKVEWQITTENGAELLRHATLLSPGINEVTLKLPLQDTGIFRGELRANNHKAGQVVIPVRPPYMALLISQDYLNEKQRLDQFFSETIQFKEFTHNENFTDYPLIVLGENSVSKLPPESRHKIVEAVRNGCGLLAITGRSALLKKEDVEPSFAELFPFQYENEEEKKLPTVALVIIIDTSGSMRGPRMNLARETARLALEHLEEKDLAGIVEFHGNRRWAAPLQSAANQFSLMRALNRLNAGGGTVILPAIAEAHHTLRNTNTRLKHVLILTDGGVEYGDFEGLIRSMAKHDITVSTVLVGPGESDFLNRIANWGNGRFYRVSSRFALPDLQFRPENRKNRPPYQEGTFTITRVNDHPAVAEFPAQLSVGGIVKSTTDKKEDIILSANNLPLLGIRDANLGKVAVWNSESGGKWSREIQKNPQGAAMFSGLARMLPDPLRFNGLTVLQRSQNRDLDLEFETIQPFDELEVGVKKDTESWYRLKVNSNGSFRLRLPNLPEGEYEIMIKGFTEKYYFVSRQAPAGYGMDAISKAAEINAISIPQPQSPVRNRLDLAPMIAMAGGILFLLLLGLRRSGKLMALLLTLILFQTTAWSGNYESFMRQGIDYEEQNNFSKAAEIYKSAIDSAINEEDRLFAQIYFWDMMRRSGSLAACPANDLQAHFSSIVPAYFLINELEDRKNFTEAWQLALDDSNSEQGRRTLLRLAWRIGKQQWLNQQANSMMNSPKTRIAGIQLKVQAALLHQKRSIAESIYLEQLKNLQSADEFLELSRHAENHGFQTVAEKIIFQAMRMIPDENWNFTWALTELYHHSGKNEAAILLLKKQMNSLKSNGMFLLTAGDWSERLGDLNAARFFYEKSEQPESITRLAALDERQGKLDEAAKRWLTVIRQDTNAMRIQQAIERFIELKKKASALPAFQVQLEAEFAQKTPSIAEQRLYTRVLAGNKDQEGLIRHLNRIGDQDQLLSTLLEFRLYSQAEKHLRQMMGQDPQARPKHLQRLALIGMEKKDFALVKTTLSELLQIAPAQDSSVQEFAGAIYAMVGEYPSAKECYEKAIRLAPEKSELLLLWANARRELKETTETLHFFADELQKDTCPPERYGVLIDGLLNLNAPEPLIRTALNTTLKRIDLQRDNLFYHQLAEDLAEELGDSKLFHRLEREQAIIAPERRNMLQQKFYWESRQRSDQAASMSLAHMLLARGEIYPSELYRDLAQFLVANRYDAAAERCMRDADLADGGDNRLRELAKIYSDFCRFDEAERIYHELLVLYPNNLELLKAYSAMLEYQGRYKEAAEASFTALTLLCQTQPAVIGKRSGNQQTIFERQFVPLLARFCNQAIMNPEIFAPRIQDKIKKTTVSTHKKAWQGVWERFNRLQQPDSTEPPKRIKKHSPPIFEAQLSRQWRILPDREAAQQFQQFFKTIPPTSQGLRWVKLVGEFDWEPGPFLKQQLRRSLKELNSFPQTPSGWELPYAIDLKNEYVSKALAKQPDSLPLLALSCRMRHLSGDAEGARLIAELIYDELDAVKEMTISDLRLLHSLHKIYANAPNEKSASGEENLTELIHQRKAKKHLTLNQLLVLGSLFEASDANYEAQKSYAEAWSSNRNSFVAFWALRKSVALSGKSEEWVELMLKRVPNDQTVLQLYGTTVLPYLRTSGRLNDAKKLLSLLNPTLRQNEELLLARAEGKHEKLVAAFMNFQRSARENGRNQLLFERSSIQRGIPQKTFTALLPKIAAEVPESRQYLAYLLQGTLPHEPAFHILYEALYAITKSRQEKLAGSSIAARLWNAAFHPSSKLTETKNITNLLMIKGLPVSLSLALFKQLPESERKQFVTKIGRELWDANGLQDSEPNLQKLLNVLTKKEKEQLAQELATLPYSGERDSIELFHFKMLNSISQQAGKQRLQDSAYPVSSALRLLQNPTEENCRNYLLVNNDYPPWEELCRLPNIDLPPLLTAWSKTLEKLGKQRILTASSLVRQYALLAAHDPTPSRKLHLQKALEHHNQLNGASLWLLDALIANGEYGQAESLRHQLKKQNII